MLMPHFTGAIHVKGTEAFSTNPECPACGGKGIPFRSISFVDAPGHETLMATMLSGSALMDGAMLVIAASEKCPQPQTKEHLMALELVGIKNIVIVQSKIDVVSQKEAIDNYHEIKAFIKGTLAENAPIIPVSSQKGINMGALVQALDVTIPEPERDPDAEPLMLIARSFDVNKPGCNWKEVKGGVVGGSLIRGSYAPMKRLRSGQADKHRLRTGSSGSQSSLQLHRSTRDRKK